MYKVLSIAGSDSSGGAGIQADIKTMIANGVYAMTAITALTAQNTTGVFDVLNVTPEFLGEEIDAVFTDIRPDAVKIGMVSSSALIQEIIEKLSFYRAENIVVDPVMVSTSGHRLIDEDAYDSLTDLFSLARVITPNIPEAQIISGMTIEDAYDMQHAAQEISQKYSCSVLIKGGHCICDATDYLYEPGIGITQFPGNRIDNPNTHGTGCTLSSAIASNLAKGYDLTKSIDSAKQYLTGALSAGLDLGHGSGPLDHGYSLIAVCS